MWKALKTAHLGVAQARVAEFLNCADGHQQLRRFAHKRSIFRSYNLNPYLTRMNYSDFLSS
ncbi:MAG: hypothetical protein DME65_07025 [Verrucomicrobia bacterium]|nr:MAG: hypothetical protein DME65_07025 [Verrucomicrobiota bacterium]